MARFIVLIFSTSVMILGAGDVSSQTTSTGSGQAYPNKPLRIVTGAAGGAADVVPRIISQGISSALGQPVIIENRGGIIPNEIVAKAAPDGYTLLVDGTGFWLAPLLKKMPYDPVRDFSPISLLSMSPNVLVVNPSLPVKSVKELIALAKAKPGELNYGSGPNGGTPHLTGEYFKSMAGVNIVRIPFSGGGPSLIALMGGETQLAFHATTSVAPHVKSGRLRALAVTSAQPSALVPGVPTVAASGLPGFEAVQMLGIFAPAKTPDAIIRRLNQEIRRVQAGIKEKLLNDGAEVIDTTPAQFAATIKSDMTKWAKVIKDADIHAE